MSTGDMEKFFSKDIVQRRMQDAADEAVRKTNQRLDGLNGLDGGKMIQAELNATNFTKIQHGLGRKPTGWVIVNKDSGVSVFSQSSGSPSQYIELKCASGTMNATIMVF